MGRYYSTQTGKEGKFWFAVQPSDDPRTVYHMGEIEPDDEWDEESGYSDSYTDYESADAEKIKKHGLLLHNIIVCYFF